MAKVAYGKLGLTKKNEVKSFEFNGQTIEVLQYLPIDEKTQMFERIINNSADDNGYYNVTKVNFWIDMEIVFTYTNINFTDKQKENLFKIYDALRESGLLALIKDNMKGEELMDIVETIWDEVKEIYRHANSALGIMKTLATDYDNLNLDALKLKEDIADPQNLSLLKDILTKLG